MRLRAGAREELFSVSGYVALHEVSAEAGLVFGVRHLDGSRALPFSLNLSSRKLHWYGDEQHPQFLRVGLAEHGGRYVLSEHADRFRLERLDAAGRSVAGYMPAAGEVTDFRLLESAGAVAALVDLGVRTELVVLDAQSLTVRERQPQLPPGTIRLRGKSLQGSRLLLELSSVSHPYRAYLLDTELGAHQAVASDDEQPSQVPARWLELRIPAHDSFSIPVHTYLPVGSAPKWPVLVILHGGPGDVSRLAWDPFWSFYVQRGFAVVVPNVRGSTGFGLAYQRADRGRKRLDAFHDLETVNRWIRSQAWWDGKTIVVLGGSYGGYLTYVALARQSDLWSAGVSLVGPSSLRSLLTHTTGAARAALEQEFGSLERDGAFLDAISPLFEADKIRAPVFVYQGENDPIVPRSESEQMLAALERRGVPVEYQLAAGEGHSIDGRSSQLEFLRRSLRFLRRTVLR